MRKQRWRGSEKRGRATAGDVYSAPSEETSQALRPGKHTANGSCIEVRTVWPTVSGAARFGTTCFFLLTPSLLLWTDAE